MKEKNKPQEELKLEVDRLRAQLAEAEETLRAIRSGEVDALVVSGEKGDQVFTLKGAEQPYRIIIEEMSEGAAMLTGDDSILYCNCSFAGMLKTPLEKLMGSGIAHYIAPSDETFFLELLREGRDRSSNGEITLLAGDGRFVPVQISFNTLEVDNSRLTYLVATDLTGQKLIQDELRRARDELEIRVEERTAQLAKSEQRWATTLASIGDAVIATDVEGRITFLNAEAESLTGWALAEALTKPITEVFNIINGYTRLEADNPVCRVLKEGMVIGLANHTILVRKDGTEVPIDDSGAPIRDGGGKTMGVVLVFRDITERKQAEEENQRLFNAVQEEKDRLSSLVNSINDEIWFADTRKRFTLANPSALQEFGFSSVDGIDVEKLAESLEVYRPDGSPRPTEEAPPLRALNGEVVRNLEEIIRTPDTGELRYRQVSASPVRDSSGNIIGSVSVVRDITENKKAEEALRESEQRWATTLASIGDAVIATETEGRITYMNTEAEALTGWTLAEASAKPVTEVFNIINEYTRAEVEDPVSRVIQEGLVVGLANHTLLVRKDGTEVPIDDSGAPIKDRDGTTMGVVLVFRDITGRKRAEEALLKAHDELELRVQDRTARLKESLEEKEILLREVHHRVKNNMQVISGLLMLQEEFSNDENVKGIIKESQNRIDSMALIHEKLYRSESLSRIDFKEYIEELVSGLFLSYGITERKVRLKINAENISMGIDKAIPCGLIINELISNSLKHAFPLDKNGEIEISLSTYDEDMIELSVRDNGIGIPEGIDFRKTESLGLHIVNILVENQLHGEITMNNDNGTEFRIRFRGIK
ncbi:MAG: PAS domain S-box protein [Candidatus Methanoperedens sp.]|nr:PAS domain S-box protein [Candidatus Methanoperedens sp.]